MLLLSRNQTIGLLLYLMLLAWLWTENSSLQSLMLWQSNHSNQHGDDSAATHHQQQQHWQMGGGTVLVLNQTLCIDPDDPAEWWRGAPPIKAQCPCPDPLVARERRDGEQARQWRLHNEKLERAAAASVTLNSRNTDCYYDVVFYGDSLVERLGGTSGWGKHELNDNRAVFEKYFDKNASGGAAPFHELALGSNGDLSVELLWHLQNGWLPDNLNPKVFVLWIGTNDLGDRGACSKRTTAAGIWKVAQYLWEQRRETPILLHGLLPRSDHDHENDLRLGRIWRDCQWVNDEIYRYRRLHDNWHFFDSTNDPFLQNSADRGGTLDPKLQPDGLHPNADGYDLWAPIVVQEIQKVLNGEKN